MIAADLLKILCCPETHLDLRPADPALVARMNQQIAAGSLRNRGGKPVTDKLDEGLVRADGKYLYPVRQNLPILLIDEAVPLA